MKLIELEAEFYRYETKIEEVTVVAEAVWDQARSCYMMPDGRTYEEAGSPTKKVTRPVHYLRRVQTLAEAHGVSFLCPKCFQTNKGAIGTHGVPVDFKGRGVPDECGIRNREGQPVRWGVSGSSLYDLSTTPSILMLSGCAWHGYITNGEVTTI